MPREKSGPPMEHLNVRIPRTLRDAVDIRINSSQDSTLQAGVAEALEMWLQRSSDLGSIGRLSPRDRATVEEWAAALLRRDEMAEVALRLMEVNYAGWRAEATASAAIARNSQEDRSES